LSDTLDKSKGSYENFNLIHFSISVVMRLCIKAALSVGLHIVHSTHDTIRCRFADCSQEQVGVLLYYVNTVDQGGGMDGYRLANIVDELYRVYD
jgi:hypothetical protein